VLSIQKAKLIILQDPSSPAAQIFFALISALESESEFVLGHLYTLGYEDFHLAVSVIKEWRLDRYYLGKSSLTHSLVLTSRSELAANPDGRAGKN
jgi:hypothetical protein